MRIPVSQYAKIIGILIAAGLAIAAAFGVTVEIPVIDPVFPVR